MIKYSLQLLSLSVFKSPSPSATDTHDPTQDSTTKWPANDFRHRQSPRDPTAQRNETPHKRMWLRKAGDYHRPQSPVQTTSLPPDKQDLPKTWERVAAIRGKSRSSPTSGQKATIIAVHDVVGW